MDLLEAQKKEAKKMISFTKKEIVDMFNEAVDIIQRKKKFKTFHAENVLYELIFLIEEKERMGAPTLSV